MTTPDRETGTPLGRRAGDPPAAPVRIVHLGLGAFHRAHQAYFTDRAVDAANWGIAAFSGRSAGIAEELAAQDGLFTLVERSADHDSAHVVRSIVEARPGKDLARLIALLSDPQVVIVTLTITEAGYHLDAAGALDEDDEAVRSDAEGLALIGAATELAGVAVSTALGRLVVGLESRRRAGAGPISIVPCDNLPGNGELTRRATRAMAGRIGGDLVEWIDRTVSFVSTSVDRITPRAESGLGRTVRALTGAIDECPVVAEPYTDWVLAGSFPGGRPRWESAGARFVTDIAPYERRKLRMLNGAHTLMAVTGPLFGYRTVAEAASDPVIARWLDEYWDEAASVLGGDDLDLPGYRARLLERFTNRRIEHRLEQIAEDSPTKIRLRVLPTMLAAHQAGKDSPACARIIAGWLRSTGAASLDPADAARSIIELDERLGRSDAVAIAVAQGMRDIELHCQAGDRRAAGVDRAPRAGVVTLGETMALVRTENPGGLAHSGSVRLGIGGAESNVAIGLARLGEDSTWIGRVGDDALGELVVREVRAEGVTVLSVADRGATTGLMIKERRTPAHTSVVYYRSGSAGSRLCPSDIDEAAIGAAGVLHLTGITPALSASASDAVDRAIAIARSTGTVVSFDVNYRSALWTRDAARDRLRTIISDADLVFAGADEAEMILGRTAHADVLASDLLELGPSEAVVKCGADGAVTARPDGVTSAPAIDIDVVDTVGAGDAFVAGYLHALLRGEPVATRLRIANATGAHACLSGGDWEGAARARDLDRTFDSDLDPVTR